MEMKPGMRTKALAYMIRESGDITIIAATDVGERELLTVRSYSDVLLEVERFVNFVNDLPYGMVDTALTKTAKAYAETHQH